VKTSPRTARLGGRRVCPGRGRGTRGGTGSTEQRRSLLRVSAAGVRAAGAAAGTLPHKYTGPGSPVRHPEPSGPGPATVAWWQRDGSVSVPG
jgi:hypothetical protein